MEKKDERKEDIREEDMTQNDEIKNEEIKNETAEESGWDVDRAADTYTDALFLDEQPAVQAGYFKVFGLSSLLYAIVYTVCMFHNSSGITMPVWIGATLLYAVWTTKQISAGVRLRPWSWIYMVVMLLLGIATCMTDNGYLICLNYVGFFIMLILFLLHNFQDDSNWDFTKSLTEIIVAAFGAVGCMLVPFTDGYAFCQEKRVKKNQTLRAVLIGLVLAVPGILFLGFCLMCADAVFDHMVMQLFSGFRFPVRVMEWIAMLLFGYFSSYCGMRYLLRRSQTQITAETHRKAFDPVIAMTFVGMLLMMYLVFCGVQVLYLFAGNMQLPKGMTYADYAHRGFYMLLFVCLVNLVIVLFIRKYFAGHKLLDGMLLLICACTFVMIASSAYRMFLYIAAYQLTFLRVFVLAALVVLTLLMAGVVVMILRPQFPLFRYSLAVVSVIYLCLAFANVDGRIASYNLSHEGEIDWGYLSQLSLDAAPVAADYYATAPKNVKEQLQVTARRMMQVSQGHADWMESFALYDEKGVSPEVDWFAKYMYQVCQAKDQIGLRSFNFSRYRAVKLLGQIF